MREQIINNLGSPGQLEKLYRGNKSQFKSTFNTLFSEIKENATAQIWNERLNYESPDIHWGTRRELIFVVVASLLAGAIAKLPDFTSLDPDFFYPRNAGFIVFPLLTLYLSWKQNLPLKQLFAVIGIITVALVYINLLPENPGSDTLVLAFIHLPFLLWALLGFAYVGGDMQTYGKRLHFLRFTGDLLVMSALIAIAGVLFSVITVGLFSLLEIPAEVYYFKYVGVWGVAAIPFIAAYLVLSNPQLVSKVSPVIAKIFTPLVLFTLTVFLIAVIITGKDPYHDREFLLIFNVLLIGVMALILFSIAGTPKNTSHKTAFLLLFSLSVITLLVNGVALSAIVYRVSEWGITPNRLAVLGSNILIFIHLVWVALKLFKILRHKNNIGNAEDSIAAFLPIYVVWVMLVCFVFPIIFNFG